MPFAWLQAACLHTPVQLAGAAVHEDDIDIQTLQERDIADQRRYQTLILQH